MADIAISPADFEHNIKLPANDLQTIADQKSASIPAGFITLYQHIVSLISLYQSAFEEENFNRMAQYVIAINRALSEYFKNEDKTQEVQKRLAEIEDSLKDSVKNLIKEKSAKPLSKDDLKNEVYGIVEGYKKKIIDSLQAFALVYKNAEDKKPDSSSEAEPIKYAPIKLDQVKKIPETAVHSANVILMNKQIEFNKSLKKFSVSLGGDIISKFRGIASKLTFDNLKRFKNNLTKLDRDYNTIFSAIIYDNSEKVKKAAEAIKKSIGYNLKNVLKIGLDILTVTLTEGFCLYYAARTMKRIVFFWGAKLLRVVGNVLNFAKRLIVGAIKTAINVVSGIVSTAYKGVALIAKGAAAIVAIPLKLSKTLYSKIVKLSGISIGSVIGAFFMSYPGAYFLGYMMGRVWRLVLKTLGISDESIQNGDYSVKDDVLMPFFKHTKEKFDSKKSNIAKILSNISNYTDKEYRDKQKDELFKKLRQTDAYKEIRAICGTMDDIWKKYKDIDIATTVEAIKIFWNDTLGPWVSSFVSVVNVFAGGVIKEPKMFGRINRGLNIGFGLMTKWGRRMRGGFKGVFLALLAAGVSSIIGQIGSKPEETKDDDFPIKLKVSKKYANLYTNGIQTKASLAKQTLGHFFKESRQSTTNSKQYGFLLRSYERMIEEKGNLENLREQLTDLWEVYKDDPNESESLANTELAKEILYYNGQSVISVPFSNIHGFTNQIKVLDTVLDKRLSDLDFRIRRFRLLAQSNKSLNEAYSDVMKYQAYLPERIVSDIGTANLQKMIGNPNSASFSMFFSGNALKNATEIDNAATSQTAFIEGLNMASGSLLKAPSAVSREDLSKEQRKIASAIIPTMPARARRDGHLDYQKNWNIFSPIYSQYLKDNAEFLNNTIEYGGKKVSLREYFKTNSYIDQNTFRNDPTIGVSSEAFYSFLRIFLSDSPNKYNVKIDRIGYGLKHKLEEHLKILDDFKENGIVKKYNTILKNIAGIVNLFYRIFCKDLLSNELFKNLKIEQDRLDNYFIEAVTNQLSDLQRNSLNSILDATNENEATSKILEQAEDIFRKSIMQTAQDLQTIEEKTTSIDIKDLFQKEIDSNHESLKSQVDSFVKEKTDLLAALKDLLDLAKPDKKENK